MLEVYSQFESKLEIAITCLRDAIRNQGERKLSIEELNEVEQCMCGLFNLSDMLYKASKLTYLEDGRESAERYTGEIIRLLKRSVDFINSFFAEYEASHGQHIANKKFSTDYFPIAVINKHRPAPLKRQVDTLNWMFHFLSVRLYSFYPATTEEKKDGQFEDIFATADAFRLCTKTLMAVEAIDEFGKCILTERTGYKLFAAIAAMKKKTDNQRIFKKDYSDLQLLGYFNGYLGTQYVEIKRDSQGYKNNFPKAKAALNR
jgi:hypothetical protein